MQICLQLEACAHPFFDELRDPETCLPNGHALPPLFNFSLQGKQASFSTDFSLIYTCMNLFRFLILTYSEFFVVLAGVSSDLIQRLSPTNGKK